MPDVQEIETTASEETATPRRRRRPRVAPSAPTTTPRGQGRGADLIESLLHTGRRTEAGQALEQLGRAAERTGVAWTKAVEARCRGLMAEGAQAQAHFAAALALHGAAGEPFDRARSELCQGQSLRRAGRREAATGPLRSALAAFAALAADPWAERARAALRKCGVTAPGRKTQGDLTAQERKVAVLAARGLTNREVAERMFLSVKTVEFHLANVYRKCGVRSRTQLVNFFAAST